MRQSVKVLAVLAGLAIFSTVLGLTSSTMAVEPDGTRRAESPTLREILVDNLRPRLAEEFAFVNLVVAKVDAGVLPYEMVISTFNWSRGRHRYPFPYFQRGLRIRASKIGVRL